MRPFPLEQRMVAYLEPRVGAHTATRIPATMPDAFVRVTRVGGFGVNLVQSAPRLLVECFGRTQGAAWRLASEAYAALVALDLLDTIPEVHRVLVDEPVNYPDVDSGYSRYQFIATLTTNLEEA